ncbi:MAG: hypothetical protein EBU90_07840 [Proteobacteria bacterium]|nr:hypothetical protein [Pseudomonadota bacterium]NBP14110.1 hypothetical protein [bacterium]
MISKLKEQGYTINDPWDAVTLFENSLAQYANSQYAVCLDSCSNALFLCMKYLGITGKILEIPKHTYASVPMQCIHAGNRIKFIEYKWSGLYPIGNTGIIDSATRFSRNMYVNDSYQCLSFHHRKTLKIGRGGAILTNDKQFVDWVRPMIYDGRHKDILYDQDELGCIGYHMYMTPEDAAIGLLKLLDITDSNPDTGSSETYKDLSLQQIFFPYIE